jgi:outer membrane protein assembly factor BamB
MKDKTQIILCLLYSVIISQMCLAKPPEPTEPVITSAAGQSCVKWRFETAGSVTAGAALGPNNKIYVGCEGGRLYVLNKGGHLLGSTDFNAPVISSPTVNEAQIAYVAAGNSLYALDSTMGILWSYQTEAIIYGSAKLSTDGKIYVSDGSGLLYALDPNGNELWRFETAGYKELGNSIFASAALAEDGTVYLAGLYDPNLYALEPADGSIKWVRNFQHSREVLDGYTFTQFGWPFASPVVAEDGTIYQGLVYDPKLYAISPADGSIIWSIDLHQKAEDWLTVNHPNEPIAKISNSCWSEPVIGPDGTIYVSFDDPYLRAVEPNGTLKWVTKAGDVGGFTMSVSDDGLIYAASDDGHLYVIGSNGEQLGQFEGDNWMSFPALTVGNAVIVSDSNNTVWAIQRKKLLD